MIYTRFGDPCELVREAVPADVKKFENRRRDAEDKRREADHMRFICRYLEPKDPRDAQLKGKEFLADLAFLRADDGWKEIVTEAAKIQPQLR